MIFDNYENDEDVFKPFPQNACQKQIEIDISLDDLILERNERENHKDFSSYYETYQIQIGNKTPSFEIENKENMALNSLLHKIIKPKSSSPNILKLVSSPSKLIIPVPKFDFSLNLKMDQINLSSLQKKLLKEESDFSSQNSTVKKRHLKQFNNLDGVSAEEVFFSPKLKHSSNVKLAKRNLNIANFKNEELKLRKNKFGSKKAFQNLMLPHCRKLCFVEHPYSIEDLSNFRENKLKTRKQKVARSFSTNSIAREIFKSSLPPQNPSFQSILSNDFIGNSKIEIGEIDFKTCCFCSKEFRLRDLVAEIFACRHSFHKECLDEILFKDYQDGKRLLCPFCNCLI